MRFDDTRYPAAAVSVVTWPRSIIRLSAAKTRKRKVVAVPADHVTVVHKVKAGDTLWSIALKYDVYISEITRWNLIKRRSVLKLGQKIKIFVKPGQLPSAS